MSIFDASNASSASQAWSNNNSNSNSVSNSWSNTQGINATNMAIQNANNANSTALEAWREAAEYNDKQAEIQRAWQERMSNTQYQRAIEDMRKAGLNPIMALANGFSGSSIGSGATASMTAPSSFMASTFPEQNSASTAKSTSTSQGQSESNGWSKSESGLATFLESIRGLTEGLIANLTSSKAIDINLNGLEAFAKQYATEKKKSEAEAKAKANKAYEEGRELPPLTDIFGDYHNNLSYKLFTNMAKTSGIGKFSKEALSIIKNLIK